MNYDLERKNGTIGGPSQTANGKTNSKCDNGNVNIPTSGDLYSTQQPFTQLPNSSTLSSISSFSSNSSSSTNSSNSSFGHHHFANNSSSPLRLPQLVELEERMSELDASTNPSNFYQNSCGGLGALGANTFQRKHQPPSLPPIPPGLTAAQIKRRHIVASIVHSENNYVATLHRLVRVSCCSENNHVATLHRLVRVSCCSENNYVPTLHRLVRISCSRSFELIFNFS